MSDYCACMASIVGLALTPLMVSAGPLHDAAQKGDVEQVGTLIAAGADLEEKDRIGTALHHAAMRGYPQIVGVLLESGAAPDSLTKDGGTALHRATYRGDRESVELLLAAGADTNIEGFTDGAPLHLAAALGELRCLDAATGDRKWETSALFSGKKASLANAFMVEQAGRQWIWTDQGELILARLSPAGYEELSRAKLLEPQENTRGRDILWCHPAFANRCAFMHNGKELICVTLAQPDLG
jgi:hypothetical protein